MDTSKTSYIVAATLRQFIQNEQMEPCDDGRAIRIIRLHETDALMRQKNHLSFDGFTRFLTDEANFAFVPEQITMDDQQMHHPLSYYYCNTSHNTYRGGCDCMMS